MGELEGINWSPIDPEVLHVLHWTRLLEMVSGAVF